MVVAGRYTLERCLNTGGIGSLWLARDEQTDTPCGLRLAESSGQGMVELAARYLTEVDVIGRIRCENVVDILDYGDWNGMPFLVVEHVEGEELTNTIARKGPMQPKAAYRIVAQTARALARAHAVDVVHGDLTPEHVLITSDGMQPMAKVFNFGLSQRAGDAGGTKSTRIGSFLRLPYYSSPEQITSKDPDWRSDLWSLAVITHECLVGKKPFASNAFGELVASIMVEPVPPLLLPGGRTPAALQAWWEKATNRDREQRYQSAKELSDALGNAFGFPLVFVPEPTGTSGSHASPASLPIVLRDSSSPPPSDGGVRAITPNPKLRRTPFPTSSKPPQVTVRSNSSPVDFVSRPISKYIRQLTEAGLGVDIPERYRRQLTEIGVSDSERQVSESMEIRRSDTKPGIAISEPEPPLKPVTRSVPPSSLRIDVDLDIPSSDLSNAAGPVGSGRVEATTRHTAFRGTPASDEESSDPHADSQFPISEGPTVARKPARAAAVEDAIGSPEVALFVTRGQTSRAKVWWTIAILLLVGSSATAYTLRVGKRFRVRLVPSRPAAVATLAVASSLADAGVPRLNAIVVNESAGDEDRKQNGDSRDSQQYPSKSRDRAQPRSTKADVRAKNTDSSKPKYDVIADKGSAQAKLPSSGQFPTAPSLIEPVPPATATATKSTAAALPNKPAKPKPTAPIGNDYGI